LPARSRRLSCPAQKGRRAPAGGTDLLLRMKRRAVVPEYRVALKNIPDLKTISCEENQ
jgi:CO/xanthine dehydrogenase FAD-binding subunit